MSITDKVCSRIAALGLATAGCLGVDVDGSLSRDAADASASTPTPAASVGDAGAAPGSAPGDPSSNDAGRTPVVDAGGGSPLPPPTPQPTWQCVATLAATKNRCALDFAAQCTSCIASTRSASLYGVPGAESYLLGDTTGTPCPERGATDLRFRDLDQDGLAECLPSPQGYAPMLLFCACE